MSRIGSGYKNPGTPELPGHRLYYGDDVRRERKLKDRELAKFAPRLGELIWGRRYVLPNYRQPDYYPQRWGDLIYGGQLMDPIQVGRVIDDVANAGFCNAIRAMECRRPQLWLERELGEALVRTEVPADINTDDVKFRWPGMRIWLPKRLLALGERDLMFFDVCCVPLEKRLNIPEPYAAEINALGREYNWPYKDAVYCTLSTAYAQTGLFITGNLNGRDPERITKEDISRGDFMLYGVIKPFDDLTLGSIARVAHSGEHLDSPYKSTERDDEFCEKILHVALQTLLYLGSMPMEYEPEILRKGRTEGKHSIPALLRAKFVGQSQLRAKPAHQAEPVHHTGRQLPAHWVAGHWKRQAYGAGRAERKLIWIQPYQTYGPEEEK